MYEKIALEGKTQEEWKMLRKTGIGGSDAGAVVGVNPYRSAMNVYLDKISNETEQQENEAIRCGHDLEQYVADRFTEATGLKVRKSNFMYRSVEHPFMFADVDRLVVGEDAGLECKTCSAYNASAWDDQSIPESYIVQCYHYMAVTGKKTWYIACLIMGVGFVYRKLCWDDAIIMGLIETEQTFWYDHVVPRSIPKPDGSDACSKALNLLYPNAQSDKTIDLDGVEEKLNRRAEIIKEIEILEQEQKEIEQTIKLAMEDCGKAKSGKYRISWENVDTTRLDTKRIKVERPDIYEQYANTSSSRRFSVKAA